MLIGIKIRGGQINVHNAQKLARLSSLAIKSYSKILLRKYTLGLIEDSREIFLPSVGSSHIQQFHIIWEEITDCPVVSNNSLHFSNFEIWDNSGI